MSTVGTAAFDGKWFDDLAKITENEVDGARGLGISENVPYLEEMYAYHLVSPNLYFTCLEFLRRLAKTRYRMSPHFRVAPRHIYVFPNGQAYRRQANVGFWTDGSYQARIGIGFDIRSTVAKSVDDYLEFLDKVRSNGAVFDNTFGSLGPYSEPNSIFLNQSSPAVAVLADNQWGESWRFYGKCLNYDVPGEKAILDSMDLFTDEVVRVLGVIEGAGFLK